MALTTPTTTSSKKPVPSTFDEIKNQVINVDKKTPPAAVDMMTFYLAMGLGIPFYLFILLPWTIVLAISEVVVLKISPPEKKIEDVLTIDLNRGRPDKIPSKEDRKYDLVLLGATGFVGQLATKININFFLSPTN